MPIPNFGLLRIEGAQIGFVTPVVAGLSECVVQDWFPNGALAKRDTAAAGTVVQETSLPDLSYFPHRECYLCLAKHILENRAPAPLISCDV